MEATYLSLCWLRALIQWCQETKGNAWHWVCCGRVLVELGRAAIIFGGSKASDKIHRILESRAAEPLLCCCFQCLTFISHTLLRTFRGPGVVCSPKEN